jgi:hypothetical protein
MKLHHDPKCPAAGENLAVAEESTDLVEVDVDVTAAIKPFE